MTEFIVGESVMIDESISDYEALRIFFQVCDERGHPGTSVVVDDMGKSITHPDYLDRMGTPHIRAGAWAFCRQPSSEAFGRPTGNDWIRASAMHIMFAGGSPYQPRPRFSSQLYVQPFGSTQPHMMAPICSAGPVAWSHDGSRVCVLDERLGSVMNYDGLAKYVLWEYELGIGGQRRVSAFTFEERLGLTELHYSMDGQWILLCDWASGVNRIVRTTDGLIITLPVRSSAVCWNPRAGASILTVMTTDHDSGNLIVHDYDLSTGVLSTRSQIRSPTGLPLRVRELSMSVDERALVTAPVGLPGHEQMKRGDVFLAAVMDIDAGQIEPALPALFRTRGGQRRHHSPRWCDDRNVLAASRTVIADQLIETGRTSSCPPDSDELSRDLLGRWHDCVDSIDAAWRDDTMPRTRLAQEFAQYAISCGGGSALVEGVRDRARLDPASRVVLGWITGKQRLWSPMPAELEPAEPGSSEPSFSDLVDERPLMAALDDLVAAEDSATAIRGVRSLLRMAHQAGQPHDATWHWLASMSDAAMVEGAYAFPVQAAAAAVVWIRFLAPNDRAVTAYGLGAIEETAELQLMLNGFEACTHLPERQTVSRDSHNLYDVEWVRTACQEHLSRLPVDDHVTSTRRPRRLGRPASAAPNPMHGSHQWTRRKDDVGNLVFMSYLRENAEEVDTIARRLRSAGFDAWVDRTDLPPGGAWRPQIRRAIRSGNYFVACFSSAYAERGRSYMNDELRLAINELRLMPLDHNWFIPILLDRCTVPDFDVDATTTLADLQYVDFSDDWEAAMQKLIKAMQQQG